MTTETIPVNFVAYAGVKAYPCIIREHTASGRGAVVEFTRDVGAGSGFAPVYRRGQRRPFPWYHLTREPVSRYFVWYEDQEGTVHKLPPFPTLRAVKASYAKRQRTDEFRAARTYGWTRQDWIAGHWVDA